MDSNSWVGNEIIPGDPNPKNGNRLLMKQFLDNNPALTVVNDLPCCKGSITRHRTTTISEEKSILDVFIVCPKVLPFIKHMKIYHQGKYSVTNFTAKKRINQNVNPDHFPVILTLDLSLPSTIPKRVTEFNFKYQEGQMRIFNMTDNNKKLAETFATNNTFKSQIIRFEKNINSIFHQTFPKIREKKRKFKEDEVGYLIK
jgi:hypothetical protein